MKLGSKILLIFVFFVFHSNLLIAEQKITTAPLINIELPRLTKESLCASE